MRPDEIVRRNVRFLRAQHLDRTRERSLWSQGGAAQRLGYSAATYVDLETGRRGLSVQDLVALAHGYGVSPPRLLMPPDGTVTVPLSKVATVDSQAYAQWVRGLGPLAGQDVDFFEEHDHESTPAQGEAVDGRRTKNPDTARGVEPTQEVLVAQRALTALLRAVASPDEPETEPFWELLQLAVAAVGAAAKGLDPESVYEPGWGKRPGRSDGSAL